MREIPAIKQSVRIKPDQATFSQIMKNFLHYPDHPIRYQYRQVTEGKCKGEKKDKILLKTEIENTIVSNNEPTSNNSNSIYYNQFYLYDFCYANWTMLSFNYLFISLEDSNFASVLPLRIHKMNLIIQVHFLIVFSDINTVNGTLQSNLSTTFLVNQVFVLCFFNFTLCSKFGTFCTTNIDITARSAESATIVMISLAISITPPFTAIQFTWSSSSIRFTFTSSTAKPQSYFHVVARSPSHHPEFEPIHSWHGDHRRDHLVSRSGQLTEP